MSIYQNNPLLLIIKKFSPVTASRPASTDIPNQTTYITINIGIANQIVIFF